MQYQVWFTAHDRNGTDVERIVLALLCVAHESYFAGDEVAEWTQKVLADGASFVDGAVWKPPTAWTRSGRWVVLLFNKFISGKSSRLIAAAALEYDGTVLIPRQIDQYTYLLRDDKLLGVGGGSSQKSGAPLRRTYLQPTVARKVHANRSALHASLAKVVVPTYAPHLHT